ncbi:MAG: ABC transporter permease [Promethearchaeota archaeon]
MMRDNLSLLMAFIRNNWRLIIVSTIGVTLALATVSEINFMAYSYRTSLFDEFVNSPIYGGGSSGFSVTMFIDTSGTTNIRSELQEIIHNSRGLGQTAAENLQFDNFIKEETWQFAVQTFYSGLSSNDSGSRFGMIDAVDNKTLQICQNFLSNGRLPQGPNETLFLVEKHVIREYPIQLGDEILLSSSESGRRSNATAIVTGIIEFDYEEWLLPSSNNSRATLRYYFGRFPLGSLLITTDNNFLDFVTAAYGGSFTLRIYGQIDIYLEQLDAFNYEAEVVRLQRFKQQLLLEMSDYGSNIYYYGVSGILDVIQGFEFFFIAALIIIWLFSLPTLVATLFLANFSLSLMRGQKQRQIGILKTRGASQRQILNILLGEASIATLISVGLGSVIGIPLTIIVLQDLNALNFISRVPLFNLLVTVFLPVLVFGILFNLLLNFRSAFRMAKMEISQSLLPREKGKPFWKKRYLDVILLSAGLLGIMFLYLFIDLTLNWSPDNAFIYPLLSFVAVFFGIPSPLLIAIGGAMSIARFLPILLRKSARWAWKIEGGIVAFSFRNVLHRLSHASRATLLISIIIALSIAFISIPYNYDKNTIDSLYYHNLGADMVITVFPASNETLFLNYTLLNYLQNNLTDVASVSPTLLADIYEHTGEFIYEIRMLGIDINTYAQTAFFREDFLNQDALSSLSRLNVLGTIRAVMQGNYFPDTPDLNTLLSRLQSNTSFLLQDDNLKAAGINVGEQLPLVLIYYNETSETRTNVRYDLDIVGTFKCWPLFVQQPPSYYYSDLYLISNLSTVLEYMNSGLFSVEEVEVNYLISLNPGASKMQVKNQILNETGYEARSIEEFTGYYLYNPQRDIMLTTINSSLLMLMIVSLFTILMFGFSQLMERSKEIGVERALGMSLRQTSLLFVIEAIIIVLFGIVVGLILGMVIAQVFLDVLMMSQTFLFPPFILVYPFDLFIGIAGLILALGLIGSLIPAILATRRQIGSILRAE